jgi:RNA polymerase sigma-70 factor (ECF subfamily)
MQTRDEIGLQRQTIEELFRSYYNILCRYVYRLVDDRDAAEDIVQDVYFDLWNRRDTLVLGDSIRSYIFRSAYTRSLNYLNSKANRLNDSRTQLIDAGIQRIYHQSQLSGPENEIFVGELSRIISRTIDTLPEQCKKVFHLSRDCDMKNREIALELGISIKAVEKHITKALYTLRSNLGKI